MSRDKSKDQSDIVFDSGDGVVIKASEGKDAGHRVRAWAETFRHPHAGPADDSEEVTQKYLEAYATAADMDIRNRVRPLPLAVSEGDEGKPD